MIHCKCVYVLDVYFVCTHFQQAVKILFVCVYNIIAKHLYVCQCTSTCTKSLMVRACVHSQQHTPLSLLLQFVLMLCGCPHPEAIKHPTHASEDSLAYTPCCSHNSSCIRLPCHSALSQELLSTHTRQCVSHVFTLSLTLSLLAPCTLTKHANNFRGPSHHVPTQYGRVFEPFLFLAQWQICRCNVAPCSADS